MTARLIALALAAALVLAACRSLSGSAKNDPILGSAWTAWERGELTQAEIQAHRLLSDPRSVDAGHLLLALVAHVQGRHRSAIAHYEHIDPHYRWRDKLTEPILWSHLGAGNFDDAITLARRYRLGQVTIDRIRLAQERPLAVSIAGVVELPFTRDELSAYMPGVEGTLNGHKIVARLDTGGRYLHVSTETAERLGIKTIGCDSGFASLSRTRLCYGLADLELGPVRLANVPVTVHAEGLSPAPLAEHFDSPMDAVIGTCILKQFLATVDGPNERVLLSARDDALAASEHVGRLQGAASEVPFAVWGDHLMIAHGKLAGRGATNLFVDSGLVMATPDQGQASLLLSARRLKTLQVPVAPNVPFTPIPNKSGFSGAYREDLLAYPVRQSIWRGYGDWGGMDVAALIGWGYLKHYSWTIDFGRRMFVFRLRQRGGHPG